MRMHALPDLPAISWRVISCWLPPSGNATAFICLAMYLSSPSLGCHGITRRIAIRIKILPKKKKKPKITFPQFCSLIDIGVVSMAGRGICIGYLAICVGIRIWRWAGARIRAHPVTAGTVYIDIDVVAPAVAVVLQDVPARNVCDEPSFVPAW